MPFLDASSSDSEPLLLVAGGANRPRAVVLRPPPAAAASDSDSDGSSTDLEDGSRFSSIPETVQSRIAAQPSAEPSNSGTSAASSSRSARPLSPAAARPTGSSRRRPDVARPSPRHRRSSSSSVVWLADDEQPVAIPSRARATSPRAPRPPPAASSDDDDEIQIEGETGPRHRRRGLALSNYVADLRRNQRSPTPPARRRSPTSPVAPPQAVRFGGAILRENGVSRHARPYALGGPVRPPPPRSASPMVPPAAAQGAFDFVRQAFQGLGDLAFQGFGDVFINGQPYRGVGVGGGGEFLHQGMDAPRHGWGQAPPIDQNRLVPLLHQPWQQVYAPPVTAQKLEDEWRAAGAFDPPPPIKTTRGFTRNFEREFGGYLSDSEDDEADVDALFAAGPVAGPSKAGPKPTYEPVVLDLTDESDEDDIAIVEADGQTSYVSGSTPLGLTPLGSPPPAVAAVVNRKRKAPSVEEAPPNMKLVCPGCNRPLILQAATASRKMHVLACGHLLDGYCLDFLSRPPGSEEASSAVNSAPPAGATRAKGKGRAPPTPRKKSFKWHCPVESCGREHVSEGVPAEDEGGRELRYVWKAKAGKGGVVPLYA